MFDHLRRSMRTRGQPTPREAFAALEASRCMYAGISACSGPAASVGLRDNHDAHVVLCCRAHYGRLRKLDARRAAELERVLIKAFAEHRMDRLAELGANGSTSERVA